MPRGRPVGTDFFTRHPEVADAVDAYLSQRKVASPQVMKMLATRFDVLPTPRTLRRYIQAFEARHAVVLTSFRDPDAYKGRFRVSLGTVADGCDRAHQIWEIDTTKADVMTLSGRRCILGVIDRWSRRARFIVAPSESAQSVRRLLAATMLAWGVMPETIVTDQGSGYINATIASALQLLGIEHRPCPPASGDKKPHIERLFGSFTRERAALLPGFVGHNVAQAQQIRARARAETGRPVVEVSLTDEQLQAILDGWVDGDYHQRVHSGLGETPIARFTASPVPAARAPSADALRIAMSAYVDTRTVGKRGVEWKRGRYWCAELAAHVGRSVHVRRDEDDLGALHIFDEDLRFIGTAVNWQRSGVSQEAFARVARAQQGEWMAQQRRELRDKQRRFDFDAGVRAVLAADTARAANVTAFPIRTVDRDSDTTRSIDAPRTTPLPSAADLDATFARAVPASAARPLTTAERVAQADATIAAADRGEAVDTGRLRAARLYATSSEYRSEKMVTDIFGPAPAAPDYRRAQAG